MTSYLLDTNGGLIAQHAVDYIGPLYGSIHQIQWHSGVDNLTSTATAESVAAFLAAVAV